MNYSNKKWYKPTKLSTKIIFMIAIIFFIRLLSNIPVPFINKDYLSALFNNTDKFSLLNNFSGGAFSQMTLMALGVTPYITASIVLQLLCVAFPRLKEIQHDSKDESEKRWKLITVATGIILSIIQSVGIAISLGKQGLFTKYSFLPVLTVCALWVIGELIIILAGEYISKYLIGNGVSIILAVNIIVGLPNDLSAFYQTYILNKPLTTIILSTVILLLIVFMLVVFTVVLTNAGKEIPVVYPNNNLSANQKNIATIPIKLNAAGVMPIIFASTLFSLPLMFTKNNAVQKLLSSHNWYDLSNPIGFIGLFIYFILTIAFAYFYTSITFIPAEIANRLRKKGATISGIRPGKPTEEYLHNKSKYMTGIGVVMLFMLTQIPTIITCVTDIYSLSFGGTSIIIVIGVIVETTAVIKSELLIRSYSKKSLTFFGINTKKAINN